MTTKSMTFRPSSGVEALLNLIYEVKFSRHVPLSVILLSAIYAIYRSTHYFIAEFALAGYVALPTAIFIELLVLGCGALVFITMRDAYIAELRKEDQSIAQVGAYASLTLLGVALAALVGIAWADAWLVTGDHLPSAIMTLVQFGQSGMISTFVITALLDERGKLRVKHAEHTRTQKLLQSNACPYCQKPLQPNNRTRHMNSCPARPQLP